MPKTTSTSLVIVFQQLNFLFLGSRDGFTHRDVSYICKVEGRRDGTGSS